MRETIGFRVLARGVILLVVAAVAACGGGDDDAGDGDDADPGQGSADTMPSVPVDDDTIVAAFPASFDAITPSTPVEVALADGTSAWVSDTGPDDGTPVLFVGGSSTSATAVDLVSFLGSAREALGLRLISVERNGFGATPLDASAGYEEFAATALGVLDQLQIERFSIVAISGGGPDAAELAAAAPERIRSLHLAAAYAGTPDAGALAGLCGLSPVHRSTLAAGYANDPASWWTFPLESVVQRIPGFTEAAVADGVRAFRTVAGRGDAAAMLHEFDLFCTPTDTDLSGVTAPAYLYYSAQDTSTPLAFADSFAARLPNVVADRRDLGGNHDEQYRHWDQILVDLVDPANPRDLVCVDGTTPRLLDVGTAPPGAILGACVWTGIG